MFDLYLQYEYYFAASQLILAMLGMGAMLQAGDFLAEFRTPFGFTAGMAAQLVGVPLTALLFTLAFDLPAGIAVGFALVAAIPGGTMSNICTYLSNGNIALSISLTAITTVGCLVTTPLILNLLAAEHLVGAVAMPAQRIALEIGLCLLLPLAVGMAFGTSFPGIKRAFAKWCIRSSIFIIGLIVIGSLGAGRLQLTAYGWQIPLILILFMSGLGMVGGMIAWMARRPEQDIAAISIETLFRNINLAVLIKASVFPAVPGVPDPIGDAVLFVALFYGGCALVGVVPQVLYFRWRLPPLMERLS